MPNRFSRLQLLIGQRGLDRLAAAKVAVFGVGGVGSYAVEALARSGIGHLRLIDHDTVSPTNINRQLLALDNTIGQLKVQILAKRIQQINPSCQVEPISIFLDEDNWSQLITPDLDYVVDAIDTISSKLILIERCREQHLPVISCMGTGNKFDPSLLQIADISQTRVDPLARIMRRALRQRGISGNVKVVFSTEPPTKPQLPALQAGEARPASLGSTAFVPPAAGMLLASAVVRDLLADILPASR